MKRTDLFIYVALIILVVPFQNCSDMNFSAAQKTQDNNGGNGLTNPGANGPLGTPGQPEPFTNSTCKIGYPYISTNPATNLIFNESDVLAGYSLSGPTINVYYTDEHPMTLGIREVHVINAAGAAAVVTSYAISAFSGMLPLAVLNPMVGSTILPAMDPDQAGVDVSTCSGQSGPSDACSRPIFPALFITDITADSTSTAGDWQFGGKPIVPNGVYGIWKSAVKTVNKSGATPVVTITTDPDPQIPQNHWNLGAGQVVPAGLTDDGWGALVTWNTSSLGLASGHTYRLQFMVHDGDQYHGGGDVGQNCVNYTAP